MMKAFTVDRYKSKDGLRAVEVAEPEVRDDDVLVQIHAAGVNPLDAGIRDGRFKLILPYRLPLILGHDLAGVVVRVGARVTRFTPGDEVYARPDKDRIGTFAELIAIDQADLAHKPATLDMAEAASLPLVGLTAWQALVEKANVQPGQQVLVHGGSGGVGTIAIQLAKHLGATVATTASSANADWVKHLGADIVIDYKNQDFETVLRDYDVVLDTQGGKTLEKSIRVVKPGGMVIGIAGPPDPAFAKEISASSIVKLATRMLSYRTRQKAKRRQVRYTFLFMRAAGDQLRQLTSLVDSGKIHPVVDKVFPFEETNQALAHAEHERPKGKVVITMR